MSLAAKLGVRVVRASLALDHAQRLFDRARSTVIARFASDDFLDAYNDDAHTKSTVYAAGSDAFRSALFHWEEEMARRALPPPPARLLIGGAGGGREVYAWAKQGYEVVAFEPSVSLARMIAERRGAFPGTEAWQGRYEHMPFVKDLDTGARVDLSGRGPFAAVIFGWPSYSHIRGRDHRIAALDCLGRMTSGPIALSFYFDRHRDERPGRLSRIARRVGLTRAGDAFSPYIGFHHWSTEAEITDELHQAGLEIVAASWDVLDGRWPWIVARRERDTALTA